MMHFTKENIEVKKTKLDGIERTENNVITNINGIDVAKLNKIEIENEKKNIFKFNIIGHSEEDEETNYAVFFMTLGLGFGIVFGKVLFRNIPIAMCTGTLLGLITGIIYSKYCTNRAQKNKGE